MTRNTDGSALGVSNEHRSHLRVAALTAIVAATVAMIGGLIDAASIVRNSVWLGIPSRFFLVGALTNAVFFFVLSFLVGLVASFVLKKAKTSALPLAIGLSAGLFFMSAVIVNVKYLPAFYAPISLLTDAAIFLVSAAIGYLAYRFLPSLRWPRVVMTCLALCLVTAIVAIFLGRSHAQDDSSTGIVSGASDGVAVESAREDLPNILFILVDTLRADHLSTYGYPHPTSPWVDELAESGILFEQAISASSHTKPATASIFTSRYPPAHQARLLREALPESSITFVQALRAAGYRTSAFSANGFVSKAFGFGRGFEHFEDKSPPYVSLLSVVKVIVRMRGKIKNVIPALWAPLNSLVDLMVGWGQWGLAQPLPIDGEDEEIGERIMGWLEREDPDPFFVYAHFLEPHAPYEPPAPELQRFEALLDGHIEDPDVPDYIAGILPFYEAPEISDSERRGLVARYDGEIASTDATLRQIADRVRALSKDRDLMIIFTSDHGEEFLDHGGWSHAHSVFSEVVHVPLIISGGPVKNESFRFPHRISMIDLAPTLLDMLDLPAIDAFQGQSLLPALKTPEEPLGPSLIFSEIYYANWKFARSIESGGLKLVEAQQDEQEHTFLFDTRIDPLEQNDLSGEVDAREIERLQEQLAALQAESEAIATQVTKSIDLDAEMVDQFRALGYIN